MQSFTGKRVTVQESHPARFQKNTDSDDRWHFALCPWTRFSRLPERCDF